MIAVAIGGLTYLRVWPPLATVMSASMSPTIKTGDIVVLKKLEGPAQIGDIVAISVPENIRTRYGYPPVIIHRVVSIDADDVVTTKGDAYKEADPFDVPRSALHHQGGRDRARRRSGARVPGQRSRPGCGSPAACCCSSACRCSSAIATAGSARRAERDEPA